MHRSLRALIPTALVLAGASGLKAESLRYSAVVKTKDGKPVVGASITLERTDINWKVSMTTDAEGRFSRVGVTAISDPVYRLTIEKEGFVTLHETIVLSFSTEGTRKKEFTLLTPAEAAADGQGAPAPGLVDAEKAKDEFNAAMPLVSQQQFLQALPSLQAAHEGMTQALSEVKDDKSRDAIRERLAVIDKVYGICLHKIGKDDDALPLLLKVVDVDPKNVNNADALRSLVEIYKQKKDSESQHKYQALLSAATGTSAATGPYNDAASAFNANNFKTAKKHLEEAIAADPTFPDSYYLLGLVDMNQGSLPGAKANFKKYLELAPNGKHAQEVKDALSAL
ncbi:MAG: carboxypeptidase regulatory-like domain-containing protein [Acidobacteria bacterium]|nr:carboxypeptidase regulatory-like domain-containing protein [Acidobacteriota bacterium]